MSINENTDQKVSKMTEDFWDPEFSEHADDPKQAVNIIEREGKFKLEVLAPGFKKKDFSISIDNGVLSILAEHEFDEPEDYLRREFSKSSFSGAFSLPNEVSPENIKAKYKGGVLSLILKKAGKSSKVKKWLKIG